VDDEEELLHSLKPVLARRGMRVSTAMSAAEAVGCLERRVFDVAVIDVKMPGMNGIDLLRQIRTTHPLTEVILLTGYPSVGRAVEGIREGAFDYLMKPCNVSVLAARIRDANQVRQIRAAHERADSVQQLVEENPVD
jgi:DNA-binding NtrC family response regulator